MNIGKFINFLFILAGTLIFAIMGIVVTMNFMKDARIFQDSVATAVQETEYKASDVNQAKKVKVNTGSKSNNNTEKVQSIKAEDKKEEIQEQESKGEENSTGTVEKIKVEVVNFSGIRRVAEEIRATLEAGGYEVSAGNDKSSEIVITKIIERNDIKAGTEIQKILKMGYITKIPDPTSRFDVTVIIGDDYKP